MIAPADVKASALYWVRHKVLGRWHDDDWEPGRVEEITVRDGVPVCWVYTLGGHEGEDVDQYEFHSEIIAPKPTDTLSDDQKEFMMRLMNTDCPIRIGGRRGRHGARVYVCPPPKVDALRTVSVDEAARLPEDVVDALT